MDQMSDSDAQPPSVSTPPAMALDIEPSLGDGATALSSSVTAMDLDDKPQLPRFRTYADASNYYYASNDRSVLDIPIVSTPPESEPDEIEPESQVFDVSNIPPLIERTIDPDEHRPGNPNWAAYAAAERAKNAATRNASFQDTNIGSQVVGPQAGLTSWSSYKMKSTSVSPNTSGRFHSTSSDFNYGNDGSRWGRSSPMDTADTFDSPGFKSFSSRGKWAQNRPPMDNKGKRSGNQRFNNPLRGEYSGRFDGSSGSPVSPSSGGRFFPNRNSKRDDSFEGEHGSRHSEANSFAYNQNSDTTGGEVEWNATDANTWGTPGNSWGVEADSAPSQQKMPNPSTQGGYEGTTNTWGLENNSLASEQKSEVGWGASEANTWGAGPSSMASSSGSRDKPSASKKKKLNAKADDPTEELLQWNAPEANTWGQTQ